MGEKLWKKICDENNNFQFVGSGEGESSYSGGYARYQMEISKEITLRSYVDENCLKVFEIENRGKYIDVVFLSKKAVIRPQSAAPEAKKYAGEIGLLGEQHPIINTAECIKLLENHSYAL